MYSGSSHQVGHVRGEHGDTGRLAESKQPVPADVRRADALPAICGGTPVRHPANRIVLGAPLLGEAEIAAVTTTLRSRWIGRGSQVERFENEFARFRRAPFAVAVSSGTAALHLSMLALGLKPGDEVIAPTLTFCSTIHSILHAGATPVLADCDPVTFNIDPGDVAKRITARTKALVVVHLGGRCCDMDEILELARRHRLRVIEDCAHALEAEYRGRPAGTMGNAGCFSFYATKSITTGDGGMVITSDRRLARRIKLLALQGMSKDAWARSGRPGSDYRVVVPGFKANMTDIEASLGLAQLPEVDRRWKRRKEIWDEYSYRLSGLPLRLPAKPPAHSRHACHLYSVLLDCEGLKAQRRDVITALDAEGVGTGVHYVPVHRQPYYRRRFGYRSSDFPNATAVGNHTISLPIGADLGSEDISDIVRALEKVLLYFDRSEKAQKIALSPGVNTRTAISGVAARSA